MLDMVLSRDRFGVPAEPQLNHMLNSKRAGVRPHRGSGECAVACMEMGTERMPGSS